MLSRHSNCPGFTTITTPPWRTFPFVLYPQSAMAYVRFDRHFEPTNNPPSAYEPAQAVFARTQLRTILSLILATPFKSNKSVHAID